MSNDYLSKENKREVRRGAFYAARWFIAAFLVIGLIGIGMWAFGVFTSDIKGRGDAIKTKNAAPNRIAAQERFEARYQEIQATDRKIDQAESDLKTNPDDVVIRTNLTGLMNHCNEVVGEYNAAARQYTQRDFRAIDLPLKIDDLDPTTDCKGTL